MFTSLVSRTWWEAAGVRALRTALVVAVAYVPASSFAVVPYLTILSAAALAAILSLLTSLAGLAEVAGVQPVWYVAVTERVVKTIAQAALAAVGNAVLFQSVHWQSVLQVSLTAGFGSLLLAFLKDLPEASVPTAVPTAADGVVGQAPVVATVPAAPSAAPAPVETATKENLLDEPAQ